jgi:hypothetical protein
METNKPTLQEQAIQDAISPTDLETFKKDIGSYSYRFLLRAMDIYASQQAEALQKENQQLKKRLLESKTRYDNSIERNIDKRETIQSLTEASAADKAEIERLREWMVNHRKDLAATNVFHKNQGIINSIDKALNPQSPS